MSTKKEFVEMLVEQILEAGNISDNIKAIKEEATKAGYNGALLVTVAKSIAASKLSDLEEKTEETLELIKELG